MIIVADTSALFAGFDADQPEQSRIAAIMETETLAISPLVITELDRLVHRELGFSAAVQVVDALARRMTQGQYRLAELKPSDIVAAQGIRVMYEALHLDLADAVGWYWPTGTRRIGFSLSINATTAPSRLSPPACTHSESSPRISD